MVSSEFDDFMPVIKYQFVFSSVYKTYETLYLET